MNGYKDMCAYQDKNHLSSNFFDCAFLWDSTPGKDMIIGLE